MLYSRAVVDYLEYLEIEKNRSQATIANYDSYLRRLSDFAGAELKVGDIDLELVRQWRLWLNRLGGRNSPQLAKATQNYHLIALRNLLKYLAQRGVEVMNHGQIELASVKRGQVNFLSLEEIDRLMTSCDTGRLNGLRDRTILELLFSSGLRVSELVGLNRDQLNLKRREFTVRGKGQKDRLVFVSDGANRIAFLGGGGAIRLAARGNWNSTNRSCRRLRLRVPPSRATSTPEAANTYGYGGDRRDHRDVRSRGRCRRGDGAAGAAGRRRRHPDRVHVCARERQHGPRVLPDRPHHGQRCERPRALRGRATPRTGGAIQPRGGLVLRSGTQITARLATTDSGVKAQHRVAGQTGAPSAGRIIPSALQARLDSGMLRLATCCEITRTDGNVVRLTDHDADIEIGGMVYRAEGGVPAHRQSSTPPTCNPDRWNSRARFTMGPFTGARHALGRLRRRAGAVVRRGLVGAGPGPDPPVARPREPVRHDRRRALRLRGPQSQGAAGDHRRRDLRAGVPGRPG